MSQYLFISFRSGVPFFILKWTASPSCVIERPSMFAEFLEQPWQRQMQTAPLQSGFAAHSQNLA